MCRVFRKSLKSNFKAFSKAKIMQLFFHLKLKIIQDLKKNFPQLFLSHHLVNFNFIIHKKRKFCKLRSNFNIKRFRMLRKHLQKRTLMIESQNHKSCFPLPLKKLIELFTLLKIFFFLLENVFFFNIALSVLIMLFDWKLDSVA